MMELGQEILRRGGKVGVELIFGLPGETLKEFRSAYDELFLKFPSLLLHPLWILPNTTYDADRETLGLVTVRPDPSGPFSIRTDFQYSRFNATNALLTEGAEANQTQIDGGNGEVFSADVDGVLQFPLTPGVRLYVMAGGGVAHRYVQLTQNVVSGGPPCGGWFSFCGPYTAGESVVASDSQTHLTWNAGAGLDFPLPGGQSWFVEARYEEIETAQPTQFIPIRVGVRF